jgi:dockerin type I repeat protein
MAVLNGDVTGNGTVNSTDIGQTKAQSGISTNAKNFRSDVTANGIINSTDISQIKANSGSHLP